jgi:hypothetical protein
VLREGQQIGVAMKPFVKNTPSSATSFLSFGTAPWRSVPNSHTQRWVRWQPGWQGSTATRQQGRVSADDIILGYAGLTLRQGAQRHILIVGEDDHEVGLLGRRRRRAVAEGR